jgi:hypothetical protein
MFRPTFGTHQVLLLGKTATFCFLSQNISTQFISSCTHPILLFETYSLFSPFSAALVLPVVCNVFVINQLPNLGSCCCITYAFLGVSL